MIGLDRMHWPQVIDEVGSVTESGESEAKSRQAKTALMLVDRGVITRAQAGDVSAFDQIVRAYDKSVLRIVSHIIAWGEDCEDVAQEVFVQLYYSIGQLPAVEAFEPSLYRLTVDAARAYLRRRRGNGELRIADLSEEQILDAEAVESDRRSEDARTAFETRYLINAVLGRLSVNDRALLALKEVQGLSLKELSQVYGVNENALKVRLFRARKRALQAHEKLVVATRGFRLRP